MMELITITTPLAALLGFAAGQLLAVAALHVGRRRGYAAGYRNCRDELETELHETTARCTSAERLLAGTQAELRQTKDQHARSMQDAREAYEAQQLLLDDAQVLNDQHARLLRQASGKLYWLAPKLGRLQLVDEERQCATLANQLGDLASWLHPQSQQQERAA